MDNPDIDEHGAKRWYNANGRLHRDDGPAVIYASGTKDWYQHGYMHRDNGPAYEGVSGSKAWYQHGKLHRTDGPAIEHANGTKSWWLNDVRLTFDQWLDKVDMLDEKKVMMKLTHG